jgi:hypothetical protein
VSTKDALPESGLGTEQREAIAKALAEHGAQGQCPACHANAWVIGHGHALQTVTAGTPGGVAWPLVSRICASCGYLSLHVASALGL